MRMNKKKSSLALVLVMLLTVVVGVAWAADVDWGTPAAPSVLTIPTRIPQEYQAQLQEELRTILT